MQRLQLQARRLTLLFRDFGGFSRSLQTNARILPQIRSQTLPSTYFPIHYSLIILSLDIIISYSLSYWQHN
jgi:hypothetical protein